MAQAAGWAVCLVATPRAYQWLDVPHYIQLTGYKVRMDHKMPGEPDVLPDPDAIVVAPATFNTINKWAAGICDTLALGLLCEAIGLGLPLVALPYMNSAQADHPALVPSIDRLRTSGVQVLFGPEVMPLHAPRQGGQAFPWHLALDAVGRPRYAPRS
jgi:phosphopantothenoylcysteine synthetase/decarboxylase